MLLRFFTYHGGWSPFLLILTSFFPLNGFTQIISGTQTKSSEESVAEYSWWNLIKYEIEIIPDFNTKNIAGSNNIQFIAIKSGQDLRLELQEPMEITRVYWEKQSIPILKRSNRIYQIKFPKMIPAGQTNNLRVVFSGKPIEAKNPPFDNGWIWTTDKQGRPWISVACQGSGASSWLPCKEVLNDEPDSGVIFKISVPDSLIAVANGRFNNKIKNNNATTTYQWKVESPINNYNIIPYIGMYVNWQTEYPGINGKLDCSYWVLDYNLTIAKIHFKQTDSILNAFEYWMGPYPFYIDGFKLVEAPMPGMEHQSAIAYGNGFRNGYNGKDFISNSGWGLKWDFILVHESGHEWFGNSITTSGHMHSWIHEGFTKYLETLYTDYVFGRKAGNEYAIGTWQRIKNDVPIIGNNTTDKYYKASAMLHTIRQCTGDSVFRAILLQLNKLYYHKTVTTSQILSVFNAVSNFDYSKLFEQYLTTTQIPNFEYSIIKDTLKFRWTNSVTGFCMPLKIYPDGNQPIFIYPETKWKTIKLNTLNSTSLAIDSNFYIVKTLLNQ